MNTIECLPSQKLIVLYTTSNPCLGREARAEENMCIEQTLRKMFAQRLLSQRYTELKVGDRFSPRIECFIPNFDRIWDGVYDRITFCGPGCSTSVREMIERRFVGLPRCAIVFC